MTGRSAHCIVFEEPGRVLQAQVNVVLPLASGSPPFPPLSARSP